MSFVIGVTTNNISLIFGDKRRTIRHNNPDGIIEETIYDDTRKVYKINDNILVGYTGIKERCEFYLKKLTPVDLTSADNLYKKLCDIVSSNEKYKNDKVNTANFLIVGKINNITYHYLIHSYHNQFDKINIKDPVMINHLHSSFIDEDECFEIINDEISKSYSSIENMFAEIINRISQKDNSVSPLYYLEYIL